MAYTMPVRKPVWVNILFFAVMTAGALIGGPLYLRYFDLSASVIILTLFFWAATGLAVTVGYHRLFAHSTYKAHPIVRFLLLFFGAASFEQSCLRWASQHRDHHRFLDTERDPYTIKKGFFYAHMGWMVQWDHPYHFENAQDLTRDRMVMHQHDHYVLWSFGAGILTPILIGALMGHALGAAVFAVCVRVVFVHHATFCINSVCHMFGDATYDLRTTARDNWFAAVLTFGEGYHNFHHRFPSDYRNGIRWYHWDPSKWMIWSLMRMKLARDLKKVSRFRILDARLAVERIVVEERLKKLEGLPESHPVRGLVHERYQQLKGALRGWESIARERQAAFQEEVNRQSLEFGRSTRKNVDEARRQFQTAYRGWIELCRFEAPELRHFAEVYRNIPSGA